MKKLTISVVIIDDEPEARSLMTSILSRFDNVQISGTAADALEGFHLISKTKPDLAFLDISMPVHTGIDLAEVISASNLTTRIVFVTAYDQYLLPAIRHSAFDYLMKPVDPEEIERVLTRFCELPGKSMENDIQRLMNKVQPMQKIKLNIRTGYVLVDPEEIVLVKADGNYSVIYLSNGEKLTASQNIGHFSELLPFEMFLRSSRSALINLRFLRQVDRKCRKITLKSGELLLHTSISREHLIELEERTR